jgi:hypothetical protein
MKALFTLLKTDPNQIDILSIQQIVALCGNGKLGDNSEASHDFREYLQIAKSGNLFKYVQTCLQMPVERGFVFQDIINEFGRRLDYSVENGLYQGKINAVGFDGLWCAPDGHIIIVEVKTSDAYRINLDTIAGYRDDLLSAGKIKKDSSVLIVVGREDTGDLEAQVRGSRHAWSFRIISADALAKLVTLKENSELASVSKIHELLVPFEYTRLDRIIDIAFTVAKDASAAEQQEPTVETFAAAEQGKQERTASDVITEIRSKMLAALSSKYLPLVRKSRALYWSADKSLRIAATISKQYTDGGYWYGYHDSWDKFLAEAVQGFYVLGCVGRDDAFAIPFEWIHSRREHLYMTGQGEDGWWQIVVCPTADGDMRLYLKTGQNESLAPFKIALSMTAGASSSN